VQRRRRCLIRFLRCIINTGYDPITTNPAGYEFEFAAQFCRFGDHQP
jgi:hypothetical protein